MSCTATAEKRLTSPRAGISSVIDVIQDIQFPFPCFDSKRSSPLGPVMCVTGDEIVDELRPDAGARRCHWTCFEQDIGMGDSDYEILYREMQL